MKRETFILLVIISLTSCKLPNIYHYRVTERVSNKKVSLSIKSFSANNYSGIVNIVIKLKNEDTLPIAISFEKTYVKTGNDTFFLSSLFQKDLKIPYNKKFILAPQVDSTVGLMFLGSKGSFNENISLRLNASNYIDTLLYIKGLRQGYY